MHQCNDIWLIDWLSSPAISSCASSNGDKWSCYKTAEDTRLAQVRSASNCGTMSSSKSIMRLWCLLDLQQYLLFTLQYSSTLMNVLQDLMTQYFLLRLRPDLSMLCSQYWTNLLAASNLSYAPLHSGTTFFLKTKWNDSVVGKTVDLLIFFFFFYLFTVFLGWDHDMSQYLVSHQTSPGFLMSTL